MRIGVDVGGTNTDAVLMNRAEVIAWTKQPTTADVSEGVSAALAEVIGSGNVTPDTISSVMIGTTHFANALVERNKLDQVGILRLASPSGEALPPLTGWPEALIDRIGRNIFLLPGGYEVDGREIAPLDEALVRDAARTLRERGIDAVAISCAFAPVNAQMEERAAEIVRAEHPNSVISISSAIGRIGFIERENAAILNAALTTLATNVIATFEKAVTATGIHAPLYISQNDGTLISAEFATKYPVLTIGSGPTNSMRGAAFLTGVQDAIVMDIGGTTTDIGVLVNGFPRESSIAVDIGGVRTNFRMPDILAIGLGGGTRIHLDPALYGVEAIGDDQLQIGPDSVGFRILQEARIFGGDTLTTSDIAVATGKATFGDPSKLPALSAQALGAISARIQTMLEDGLDRMKTARGDAVVLVVGGGNILVPETLRGAIRIVRPPYASVANAVGAAIAQVGAQVEQIAAYDRESRTDVLDQMRTEATARVAKAGGDPGTVQIVDVEETFLSYLPGRAAQVRVRAVGDLIDQDMSATPVAQNKSYAYHAN